MQKISIKRNYYLDSISYTTGEILPIDLIPELKANHKLLESFYANGFKFFSESTGSVVEMAIDCANEILNQTELDRSDIDLVIFDSVSHWDSEKFNESTVNQFLLSVGLENSKIVVTSYPACVGFSDLIWQSVNYLESGRFNNILIITANKNRSGSGRVMEDYNSIGSDAAAGCIISTKNGNFLIKDFEFSTEPKFSNYSFPADSLTWAIDILDRFSYSINSVIQRSNLILNEIDLFSFDNVNPSYLRIQLEEYGIGDEKVYFENFSRLAHTYAADNFINLADIIAKKNIPHQAKILVHNASHMAWGVLLLEAVV